MHGGHPGGGIRVVELREAVAPEVQAHGGPHQHPEEHEEHGEDHSGRAHEQRKALPELLDAVVLVEEDQHGNEEGGNLGYAEEKRRVEMQVRLQREDGERSRGDVV